jgi:CHAT domain-containing protein/tetratricopeptide (TPR) repeat protein
MTDRPSTPNLPADKRAGSLDAYDTRSPSDPKAFLDKVSADYPDFASLLQANSLEDTKRRVADIDPASHQQLVMLLLMARFQLGKIGRHDEELAAARARVEIVRLCKRTKLDCFFENSQPRNLGDALSELGECLVTRGNLDAALQTFEEAERCYVDDAELREAAGRDRPSEFDRVFGWHDFRSQLYARLSGLHEKLGNLAEAQRYNQLAWQHSKRGETPEDRFEAEIASGAGARERGDLDAALGAYWRALDLSLSLKSSSLTSKNVVEALHSIAVIHANLGLHRTSIANLRRCIELNSAMVHRGRLLTDQRALAVSLAALGDMEGAKAALDEALRLCAVQVEPAGRQRSGLAWTEDRVRYQLTRFDDAWRVLQARAQLTAYYDRDSAEADLNLALQVIERLRERVLSDERRIAAQNELITVYEDLIALHADRFAATGDQAAAQATFLNIERAKSRVLAEMLSEQDLPAPYGVTPEQIEDEARLRAEAACLEADIESGAGDVLANVERLEAVLADLDALWDHIAVAVSDGGAEYVSLRRADPIEAVEVAALIAEAGGETCLVNYYALPDRVLIIVLDPDTGELNMAQQAVTRAEIRDWVAVRPDDPPPPDLRLKYWSLDFWPLLVAPLAGMVRPGVGICFAPHDAIHSLPLHALEPGDGGMPLIEDHAISYTPSASILRFVLRRPRSDAGEALVIGYPDRPDEVPIEHTRVEAEAVADVLGCTAMTGVDASCVEAARQMPQARLVHIACHHRFDAGRPMHSALLLTDCDLTAQRLLELRLSADLVTLSACQSGVSRRRPGDELLGTLRALIYAGTRAVVVSLWNADDVATAQLMSDFYRTFVQEGVEKREALRRAEMALREMHPSGALWAPFVMFGDWR